MCWERRERSIIIFKWFFIWKKEILSLSHPRYRRLSHRLRHIRVKSFFLFGLHPYSTIPPLPQKTDISPLVEFFLKLNIKSSSFIQVKQFLRVLSLSLSLFLKIVTKYLEKQKQEKLICVCVLCCVRCGRSETFFCVEWDKNRFDNNKKKTFRYLPFLVLCFRYFFFFFLISRLWRSKNFPIRVFIHPQSPMLCVCVSGIENMEPTDWVLHLIPYIFF
jgi:hypothetical protein